MMMMLYELQSAAIDRSVDLAFFYSECEAHARVEQNDYYRARSTANNGRPGGPYRVSCFIV
jgi:hypothetical protein